jgi:hypothetical protein
MKQPVVAILISILTFQWADLADAQDTAISPRVKQELEAMLARRKAEIQKARADCARELNIPIELSDTEELVARYGLEDKAMAFNNCLIDKSGVLWSMGRALLERNSVR